MVTLLLRAVVPDRLGVFNHDLEDIGSLALLGGKVEAGEETGAVGEGLAGLGKAGLGDGVVRREEVPLNYITDLSDDVVRVEAKTTEACVDGVGDTGESDSLVGSGADGL